MDRLANGCFAALTEIMRIRYSEVPGSEELEIATYSIHKFRIGLEPEAPRLSVPEDAVLIQETGSGGLGIDTSAPWPEGWTSVVEFSSARSKPDDNRMALGFLCTGGALLVGALFLMLRRSMRS